MNGNSELNDDKDPFEIKVKEEQNKKHSGLAWDLFSRACTSFLEQPILRRRKDRAALKEEAVDRWSKSSKSTRSSRGLEPSGPASTGSRPRAVPAPSSPARTHTKATRTPTRAHTRTLASSGDEEEPGTSLPGAAAWMDRERGLTHGQTCPECVSAQIL
jgi:hypothetical protein